MINKCLLLTFGLTYLITLIPHIPNGHKDVKLNRGSGGTFILSLYTWYLWYFLTYSMQTLYIVIQKYPDLCIYLAVICPLAWIAQIPSWTSCSAFFFLLLSHPNISTMFHRMTSFITLLHRGNSPWLTFVGCLYLYWMPLRDIFDVG